MYIMKPKQNRNHSPHHDSLKTIFIGKGIFTEGSNIKWLAVITSSPVRLIQQYHDK